MENKKYESVRFNNLSKSEFSNIVIPNERIINKIFTEKSMLISIDTNLFMLVTRKTCFDVKNVKREEKSLKLNSTIIGVKADWFVYFYVTNNDGEIIKKYKAAIGSHWARLLDLTKSTIQINSDKIEEFERKVMSEKKEFMKMKIRSLELLKQKEKLALAKKQEADEKIKNVTSSISGKSSYKKSYTEHINDIVGKIDWEKGIDSKRYQAEIDWDVGDEKNSRPFNAEDEGNKPSNKTGKDFAEKRKDHDTSKPAGEVNDLWD